MSKASLGTSLAPERTVIAYHGGSHPIRRFQRSFSAMGGIFWFSEDKDVILRGESGAGSLNYLMKVVLRVQKTAGWKEYDRYLLDQLTQLGYDSVHLDDNWIMFDPNRIKVLEIVDLKRPRR